MHQVVREVNKEHTQHKYEVKIRILVPPRVKPTTLQRGMEEDDIMVQRLYQTASALRPCHHYQDDSGEGRSIYTCASFPMGIKYRWI